MDDPEEFLRNYPPIRPPLRDLPPGKEGPVVDQSSPRKILFLGDDGIGKTTFITNYCNYMNEHYRCETLRGRFTVFTQFLFYRGQGGRGVATRLIDVPAGSTEELRSGQFPNFINLVVLCFAVDDTESLRHVWSTWLPECRDSLPRSTEIHLLGLKTDRRAELGEAGRPFVTRNEAVEVHRRNRFNGVYRECSIVVDPQYARHCMDLLIDLSIQIDAP